MIINGKALLADPPISEMFASKQKHNGVSHGLSEVGYDIRIKQDVLFAPTRYHHMGEPIAGLTHKIGDGYWTQGNFVLASAIEQFDMPNDLVGIVHDKSTWARQGLSVFNTVIEPGWSGFLTLELVYHGNQPLHIPAGSGIAQVVFHRITQPANYSGKYQNQADEPVPSVFE